MTGSSAFRRTSVGIGFSVLSLALLGCGSTDTESTKEPVADDTGPGLKKAAAQELIDKGLDKYVGKVDSISEETNADGDTFYSFNKDDGPICYLGDDFHVVVHETGSENLLIFLQGGGACWSALCSATTTAGTTLLKAGLTDTDTTKNAVGDWNIVYAPYCDGSVFSGDNDMTGPMGADWHFHGVANLTATLEVAKARFPSPKRILLAGSSAGAYGTLTGTGLTRLQYPTTQLDVINDAGLGLSNPDNPAMLGTIRNDWQFDKFVPDSCTECQGGGQQTAVISWGLRNDPTLRVSAFSSYGDDVIGGIFLGMTDPDFKELLLTESGKVHEEFPDRFERFFIEGGQHTALGTSYYGPAYKGVILGEWIQAMLDGDPSWTDVLDGQ